MFIILSANTLNACDNTTEIQNMQQQDMISVENSNIDELSDASSDLKNSISNAKDNQKITINPGTYHIHDIEITKNLTLQGNGNPRDVIIDGEKKSSIFLIKSPDVHLTVKNITFINGLTDNFGGAISIETGNVYVDECIFINNTALSDTNAGAISNYGTKANKGYLLVNNSLFINNHADHDGGAITTCYANSDIYNSVFINNSAHRDGGAIRVSVFGYGNVQDCIFMFNHADEWGGAYYSWSGESNIERCIFMNNTAGTNGGAVMVSGNINIEDSIITNNNGGETGGSFYIQQPMYNTKTNINVHNNLITNNSSPYGQEVFIKWWDAYNLYAQFDGNDWGDENPNDSSVIDPDNVTARSKVKSTTKSNLFATLNVDLLSKYSDLIGNYFKDDSLENLKKQFDDAKTAYENSQKQNSQNIPNFRDVKKETENSSTDKIIHSEYESITSSANSTNSNTLENYGNSTIYGEKDRAYELNKSEKSVAKKSSLDYRLFIALIIIGLALLAIGYKRQKKHE